MENITPEQALTCKIIRATFTTEWKVVVTDADAQSYVLTFSGTAEDTDAVIENKIYNELILTQKRTTPVAPTIVNKDVTGLTPKSK